MAYFDLLFERELLLEAPFVVLLNWNQFLSHLFLFLVDDGALIAARGPTRTPSTFPYSLSPPPFFHTCVSAFI